MEQNKPKNIIILSMGKCTNVYVDGKIYGRGIRNLNFSHVAGNFPELSTDRAWFDTAGDDSGASKKKFMDKISEILGLPYKE